MTADERLDAVVRVLDVLRRGDLADADVDGLVVDARKAEDRTP